jgi:hypothetical protein
MERLLEPLRDEPLPPSAVDIGRALTDGRRRVRHQRLATVVAAGCAVLAVAGGVAFAVERPVGPEPANVSAAPMPAQAPEGFDPMRRYAAFGWLPDGLRNWHTKTGLDGFLINASAQDGSGKEGSLVELRVVTAGHDIALSGTEEFVTNPGVAAGWAEVTPAEPVNGRPARWNGKALGGGVTAALRWEYAPGAWAEVTVRGRAAGADPRATVRRIASAVRYGVDERIRLPFAIVGLPGALRPMEVSVGISTDPGSMPWSADVAYGDGKRSGSGDWPLTVLVIPRASGTGDGSNIANPDTTLDGHPARRTPMAGGGNGLQIYGADGLYLEFATHDRATTSQLPGGLDGLFRAMTRHPDPRDWQ